MCFNQLVLVILNLELNNKHCIHLYYTVYTCMQTFNKSKKKLYKNYKMISLKFIVQEKYITPIF